MEARRRLPMRGGTVLLTVLVAGLALVACGDEEPTQARSAVTRGDQRCRSTLNEDRMIRFARKAFRPHQVCDLASR